MHRFVICNHLHSPIQDVIKCSENTEHLRKTKISDKHLILIKLYREINYKIKLHNLRKSIGIGPTGMIVQCL